MSDIFEGIEGLSDEVKAQLAERVVAKSEFEAVSKKKEELLSETKAAKEAARKSEQERQEALKSKAEKEGDVEALKKFYEEEKSKIAAELDEIKTAGKRQKINGLAQDFVKSKFVDDPVVFDAISSRFAGRLDIRDGKPVVLSADGALTGMSIEDLQNEFLNTDSYKRHIVASRASGGSASGGNQGGGATKVMSKTQFDALDPSAKMDFMKAGGQIK